MKNKVNKIKYLVISVLLSSHSFALAGNADFKSVSENIYNNIFGSIVSFLIAIAFVFFAWSVFKFMISEGDKRAEAKETLLWGVIALFVMVSFWGILRVVNKTFTDDPLGQNQKYNFSSEYKKFTP